MFKLFRLLNSLKLFQIKTGGVFVFNLLFIIMLLKRLFQAVNLLTKACALTKCSPFYQVCRLFIHFTNKKQLQNTFLKIFWYSSRFFCTVFPYLIFFIKYLLLIFICYICYRMVRKKLLHRMQFFYFKWNALYIVAFSNSLQKLKGTLLSILFAQQAVI